MTLASALSPKVWSAAFGAVAGVGIGIGGLAYLRADSSASYSDAGTLGAYERLARRGPCAGKWEFTDGETSRSRRIQDDPSRPDEILITVDDKPLKPVYERSREEVGKRIAGDVGVFQANYRPAGPADVQVREGTRLLRVRWSRPGCEACAMRWIFMEESTREVVEFEDRSYDGSLLHRARLVSRASPSEVPAAPSRPAAAAAPKASFATFVSSSPLPLYEPARLPDGFQRTGWDWQKWVPKTANPALHSIEYAWIGYGDGIAQMLLLIARPEDMQVLDEVARSLQRGAGMDTCTSTANTPEDLLPNGDAVLITRRADKCRTVLRRSDLSGVTVALIGFNEVPGRLYLETMQSLAHVPGSKP